MLYALLGLLFAAAWLNGRYVRSTWTDRPTLHHYRATGGDGRTITYLWTGAFNDALEHLEGLIPIYQQIGDVVVVEYAEDRFNDRMAMLVPYSYALRVKHLYDRIVLSGMSLGGEEALLFEAEMEANPDYDPIMFVIGNDVPQGGHHLPNPAWLVWLAGRVHIGPLFNLFSPLVTHALFKKIDESETNGVDHDNWNRHIAAMRKRSLSLILEQIGGIGRQRPFAPTGNRSGYIQCAHDDVILGDESARDWCWLRGMDRRDIVHVIGGHVQVVENRDPWQNGTIRVLRSFGFAVV